jgi:hypothetical protein
MRVLNTFVHLFGLFLQLMAGPCCHSCHKGEVITDQGEKDERCEIRSNKDQVEGKNRLTTTRGKRHLKPGAGVMQQQNNNGMYFYIRDRDYCLLCGRKMCLRSFLFYV